MFDKAQKDNNAIYHELVPRTVEASPKKEMVKCIPFEVPVLAPDDDWFRELVSPHIRQGIEQYEERKANVVREVLGRLEEANDIETSSLQSMNLPGSIQSLDNPTGLPAETEAQIAAFKDKSGAQHIHDLRGMLATLAKEDMALLDEACRILDEEEQEDSQMNASFGSRWTRTPSHTLTANLRQEASKHRLNGDHAKKSDAYIQRKFDDHAAMFARLSGTRESILALLPAASAQDVRGLRCVQELKQQLAELERISAGRIALMERVKQARDADDISGTLLSNPHAPLEGVFEESLRKYAAFDPEIQQNLDAQNACLSEISRANEEFVRARGGTIGGNDRDRVLCQINAALHSYNELVGNLSEGIRFYTNFQELLMKFKQRCTDFTVARRTEKLELLNQLTATTAGMSSGMGQYASPPPSTYSSSAQYGSSSAHASGYAPPAYGANQLYQAPASASGAPQYQQPPPSSYAQYTQHPGAVPHGQPQFTPLLQPGSNNVPGGGGMNPFMYRPPQ